MSGSGKIRKRSVRINGHGTSVSLEDAFWMALHEIADGRAISLTALLEEIDGLRTEENLSSALRLHVLAFYRDATLRGNAG